MHDFPPKKRFLDALTLCVPSVMDVKHMFSAADTYALGQSLRTERLYPD